MIDADMDDKVLVAGIGNIFLSDDGFGSEAARQLATSRAAEQCEGGRLRHQRLHLAYDLLDGYAALIILDVAQRGGTPGDLAVIEVGQNDLGQGRFDAHGMEPTAVLASLGTLGGRLPRTFVICCEPADLSEGMGLSPPVAAAAARTGVIVGRLLREELRIPFSDEQSIRTVSTALEGSG